MRQDLIKLLQPLIIFAVIVITGLVGFMAIEGFTFGEAVYMTVITITTTGFSEVRPLSNTGRLFTSVLLICSWAAFAFVLTRITQYIISGEINKFFKNRKVMLALSKISGHVVICGFGRYLEEIIGGCRCSVSIGVARVGRQVRAVLILHRELLGAHE